LAKEVLKNAILDSEVMYKMAEYERAKKEEKERIKCENE